jgi:hypothetical protein
MKEIFMHSGMISQIEKARLYANEPERITFNSFEVSFEGDNQQHIVTYDHGKWHSTSHYFKTHGVCSHIMALERFLGGTVKPAELTTGVPDSGMISQIEKARLYANEPERITFNSFEVSFEGDNQQHIVTYDHGKWHSTSDYFKTHGVCSHIMALERFLGGTVKPAELTPAVI